MFYLRPKSLQSANPIFQRLESDTLLFPEPGGGLWFANKGVPEESLIQWSLQFIEPTKYFIDIGAHVGTYTLEFAKHSAGVHAFECSPRTYNFLCANIALHELDYHVKTYNVALGESNGTASYYIRSKDGGMNGCLQFEKDKKNPPIQVPMKRLDDYHLENIGFLKIDVEGYEKQVLQGAQETLRLNNYPKILFESWEEWRDREGVPAGQLRKELFEYLDSIDYNVIPIRGNGEMFLAEKRR